MVGPLASHSTTPKYSFINELISFKLLNSAQQNLPYSYLLHLSRFTTFWFIDQMFTTSFVNNYYPLSPYYNYNMTSLGLWRFPFFSLTQSSIIEWARAIWLYHLIATLILQSLHILSPYTPTLLPTLLSFTSTRLMDHLLQSPKNIPIVLELPSICPAKVNFFTDLGPAIFPSYTVIQIYHLTVIWILSKSFFLCRNLFVVQSMNKYGLPLLSSF